MISVGMESAIGTALWHCRFAGVFQTCSIRTFLLWVFWGALLRRYLAQVALPGSALTRIALCLPAVRLSMPNEDNGWYAPICYRACTAARI